MKHLEGEFQGYRDLNLYYQCWLPDSEPKAVLLIVHGLADHSGRFHNPVDYFISKGYAVYGFDQRGHGKSPGKKGFIENFSYFVEDLSRFLGLIRKEYKDRKIIIVAHSVGGTIATAYAASHQDQFDGLILSGATLKPGASVPPALIAVAPMLSLLIPQVGLYTIDSSAISRDKSIVEAYNNDPLVYRGKISTRLGVEIIRAMRSLPSQMPGLRLPLLILHGTGDRLSELQGSRMLFERAGSKDKTLKLYEGFYHEIFNDPEREQVFKDMEAWLEVRV